MLSWLNRHKGICGASIVLAFIFSEAVPLCKTAGEAPPFFTIQFFLMALPFLRPLPSWVLLIPAMGFFGLALAPLKGRPFQWIPFLLILAGLSFFPLLIWGPFGVESGPLWGVLFLSFAGLNLWARSIDYFYAGAVAAMCWDMGAGINGLRLGLTSLPEPYSMHAPPWFVFSFDLLVAATLTVLWYKRVDFGKLLGWKWLEALD